VGFVGDLRRGMDAGRWVRVANARRFRGFEERRLWQADVISFFSCFAQMLPKVRQSRRLFPSMERDSQWFPCGCSALLPTQPDRFQRALFIHAQASREASDLLRLG